MMLVGNRINTVNDKGNTDHIVHLFSHSCLEQIMMLSHSIFARFASRIKQ